MANIDKKFLALMGIFVISFIIFTSMVFFRDQVTIMTRASEDTSPSAENSLLFAWPLRAASDGTTPVKISVFVRSTNGKPLPNKMVSVSSSLGQFKATSTPTDKQGKSEFELYSSQAGQAVVEATIDQSLPISRSVSVKFE